jgi:cob(I)alamin adenosyltransferase
MPRLTKIYTRTGDDGTTGLGSRQRVSKDALRVSVYGTVDELNAVLGHSLATGLCEKLSRMVLEIQNELFNLGAEFSFPPADRDGLELPTIAKRHIVKLEEWIDGLNKTLGPLENFILPGGSPGASILHIARTICRRAEREAVSLAREEDIGSFAVPYLNRLSDALFVMSRYENQLQGVTEPLWDTSV